VKLGGKLYECIAVERTLNNELRYVAFAGDARVLQVREREPGGQWRPWGYVPDAEIPTVDASDIRAVDYVRGRRPHVN
jgi:hypothetical protein